MFITVLKISHIDFIEKNLSYSEASLVSKMQLRNLVNDWRKSKDDAIKMLVECRIDVYAHTIVNSDDRHEVAIRKTRKFDFSATGEIVQTL